MQELTKSNAQAEMSLRDMISIIQRRKWVILLTTLAMIALAAAISHRMTKMWRADAQMVLVQRAPSYNSQQSYSSAPMIETVETQVGMLQSAAMAQRTIDWLKNEAVAEGRPSDVVTISAEVLQRYITVTNPKDSNLLNVSVEANTPEKAQSLTNAVCQSFVQWKQGMAQENALNVEDNLISQSRRAKAQLSQAERQELAYQKAHQIVDMPTQKQAAIAQLQARDADVAALDQEVSSGQARLQELNSQLRAVNNSIKTGTGVRDDNRVVLLQEHLNQLESDRADAAQKYTREYLGVLPTMDAQIRDVKKRLVTAIQDTLTNKSPSLQSQGVLIDNFRQAQVVQAYTLAKLGKAISLRDQVKRQMALVPDVSINAARLQRNVDMASATSMSLEAALSSASLDKRNIAGNIQITQGAIVPDLPYRPNLVLNLLIGGVLGLFISSILALMLEQLDQSVRTPDDVKRLVGGPILGVLPQLSPAQVKALQEGQSLLPINEAISLARLNLSLSLGHLSQYALETHQTILVTSALPGEGKSLVASQLAHSFARMGKSVLLVDANLSRPSQKAWFNTGNQHGLTDVLAGRIVLEEAIASSATEGLSVLNSGASVENIMDLLSNSHAKKALHALRYAADIVILDGADCSTTADALLMTAYADCLVQVVGAGRVDQSVLQRTAEALKATGKGTMFLINDVAPGQYQAYKNRGDLYLPVLQSEDNSTPGPARLESSSNDIRVELRRVMRNGVQTLVLANPETQDITE